MRAHLLGTVVAAATLAATPAFADDVRGIAFAPDGKSAIVSGSDRLGRVIELPSGKELPSSEVSAGIGAAAAIASDGYFLTAAHCLEAGPIWSDALAVRPTRGDARGGGRGS